MSSYIHNLRLPLWKSLRRLQAAFWLRRVAHWLLRATWLGLLVPTIYMAGYLWLGWEVHWRDWVIPMLIISSLSLLWSMRPITLWRIVRRLDGRLGLQTRLVTALEVSHGSSAAEVENPVVECLLQETTQITNNLSRRVRLLSRTFWSEMQALIAVGGLLGALLMLDALTPHIPTVPPVELPLTWQEPTAAEVISDNPQLAEAIAPEEGQREPFKNEDLETALQILAEVLRDRAATHSIAEAIDRGDLKEAAEGLRRLADQLDNLSEAARTQLGDSLQEGADRIGDAAPSFTGPLQAGSEALDNDDLIGAGQALEELAQVLEQIEDSPADLVEPRPVESQPISPDELEETQLAPQEETIDENSESQEPEPPEEEEHLDAEGPPVELESDPELDERVVQAADSEAEAGDEQTEDAPFTRQPLNTSTQELGPDPLTYPWEKREVIRRYFTP
jgi:hypothetical protein